MAKKGASQGIFDLEAEVFQEARLEEDEEVGILRAHGIGVSAVEDEDVGIFNDPARKALGTPEKKVQLPADATARDSEDPFFVMVLAFVFKIYDAARDEEEPIRCHRCRQQRRPGL